MAVIMDVLGHEAYWYNKDHAKMDSQAFFFLQQIMLSYKLWHFICWMYAEQTVLFSITGHGMIVEGHPAIEHYGRRLMASAPENGTEKNCSEPGMLLWNLSCNFFSLFFFSLQK